MTYRFDFALEDTKQRNLSNSFASAFSLSATCSSSYTPGLFVSTRRLYKVGHFIKEIQILLLLTDCFPDDLSDATEDQVICSALSGEDCELEKRINLGTPSFHSRILATLEQLCCDGIFEVLNLQLISCFHKGLWIITQFEIGSQGIVVSVCIVNRVCPLIQY